MKTAALDDRWNIFEIKGEGSLNYILKWSLTSLIIGTASGVVVYLFKRAVLFFSQFPAWQILVYAGSAFGGLIIGLVFYRIEPEARGEGMPTYIQAVNENRGFVLLRFTVLKYLAGLFTLGFGGSGGFVGPMALVNGGVGSFLARKLRSFSHPFNLKGRAEHSYRMWCCWSFGSPVESTSGRGNLCCGDTLCGLHKLP